MSSFATGLLLPSSGDSLKHLIQTCRTPHQFVIVIVFVNSKDDKDYNTAYFTNKALQNIFNYTLFNTHHANCMTLQGFQTRKKCTDTMATVESLAGIQHTALQYDNEPFTVNDSSNWFRRDYRLHFFRLFYPQS
jgi:hypothetical protein